MTAGAARRLSTIALSAVALACGSESPPASRGSESAQPFRPTASIQEIMRYMVDPASDSIWGSVVTVVTADGIEEKAPESDEDWEALRGDALLLMEASNLLLMDGRRVAAPGTKSEMPGVDLEPEQIEEILAGNRPAWTQFALGFNDSGAEILRAVEARDLDALLTAGDGLDLACENCHLTFWYPSLGDQGSTR